MESIDSGAAGKQLGKLLKQVAAGESFEITKYGKVVAVLGPPTNPTVAYMDHIQQVHDEGARKRIAKAKPDPDRLRANTANDPNLMAPTTSSEEVDDWGLPVEKPAGMEMGTSKKGAIANEPKYREPLGLSKSQQAGGKYER